MLNYFSNAPLEKMFENSSLIIVNSKISSEVLNTSNVYRFKDGILFSERKLIDWEENKGDKIFFVDGLSNAVYQILPPYHEKSEMIDREIKNYFFHQLEG